LEPEASWKKKKWDVWGPLNDKSYDPLGPDDPYMRSDPLGNRK